MRTAIQTDEDDRRYIRQRCLELAAGSHPRPPLNVIIEQAQQMEDYICGSAKKRSRRG